ncbi:MAG: T9SS type A sorting domain-containing protein, partial [Sphingobacteriaceae bacterium]|nr:T9SS type A sorting domain-containing protein [Cytophagaceae bacterium]
DPLVYIFEDGNQGFSIYPNPSRDGNLTLETKEDWQGAQVTVWTLTGQLVFEDRVDAFNERKFLRMGPQPGTYIVRVRAEGFSVSKRILVVL